MHKLVISIVTWNSAATIKSCLTSVLEQSFSEFDLLIVDNNSSDQTCSIIESFTDPRIKLFKLKENTGFAAGHNKNIQNSKSDLVLLVNPDVQLLPQYIHLALEAIEKDSKIGTVCGLLLQEQKSNNESIIDSAGMEIKRSRIMELKFHGKRVCDVQLKGGELFGSDGALPLYRRSMIDDVSMNGQFFDEMFFAHKEDWDVAWRSCNFGWKAYFEPLCIAIHPRSFKPQNFKARGEMSKEVKYHAVKNQLLLLFKNESLSGLFVNFFFIVPRQMMIFAYLLLFETYSLKAYAFVLKNYSKIMLARKYIQNKKVK